ncbi:MAG: cytochrome c oxidase assembly protein [Lysinibacillus sp.]
MGDWVSILLVFLVIVTPYVMAAEAKGKWPIKRGLYWAIGAACIAFSITGSLAHEAHHHFVAHMMVHLLLGMAAPLFFVLAKPLTLLLRIMPVKTARGMMRLSKTRYARLVSHPITAALLNAGGLWLLYTTDLYMMMHMSMAVHYLVHLHIFLAGYLFTHALLSVDFNPHRASWMMRSVVLVLSIAAHNILAKWLYANPPHMATAWQAETGAQWMYYGGGVVELLIIILLCHEWYRAMQKGAGKKIEASV